MRFIFWVAVFVAVLFIFQIGIERQERAECLRWADDSKTFTEWYATDWQVDQCKAYGIEFEK